MVEDALEAVGPGLDPGAVVVEPAGALGRIVVATSSRISSSGTSSSRSRAMVRAVSSCRGR